VQSQDCVIGMTVTTEPTYFWTSRVMSATGSPNYRKEDPQLPQFLPGGGCRDIDDSRKKKPGAWLSH